ncbi:uncharacterized protein LOC131166391 isoform X2 [Malania oleifera]|uniref:uncharacterized protein LOC131166391 isoform X2 n=1 Tax=Malania oleifera TaxID=397392 RepID=UPI0025AE2799|nr:uncharacterized protein LOC131166391 isoform X2 [Malania oleifera]
MRTQAQTGPNNPHIATPFNNSNTHFIPGNPPGAVPNIQPPIARPCYMNVPSHVLQQQNNYSTMPLLGSVGSTIHTVQCHGGFGPQNSAPILNPVGTFPMQQPFSNFVPNLNQINQSQTPGQLFVYNSMNLAQNFNPSLPNGQFCLQNPMQNMNQLLPMQVPSHGQVVPYNAPPGPNHMLGQPNQVAHSMCPQNPGIVANPPFVVVHSNEVQQHTYQNQQMSTAMHTNVNALNPSPIFAPNLQGNMPPATVQSQQTQNFQPLDCTKSQGNSVKDSGTKVSGSHWKNFPRKNFTRNRREAPQWGKQKSHIHHKQNSKGRFGTFGFSNKNGGKGLKNDRSGEAGLAKTANQARTEQKRSLFLNYTKQEIQQWREERKKNYPSKANIEQKLSDKLADSEVVDKEAKLRRQQLKEILAKQAELGFEVPEIPENYLSDAEKQGHGIQDDKEVPTKKGKFLNKHNKRGRRNKNGRFAKKRMMDKDSLNTKNSHNPPSLNPQKPTLLQKLLSADIRRDKSRLLQVFRFMVVNSFFKDWPEKPLNFPTVIVRETGHDGEMAEDKSLLTVKGVAELSNGAQIEKFKDCDADDNNDGESAKNEECYVGEMGPNGEELESSEEEGEIVD